MKMQTIINSIIASGLLFTSVAFASAQEIDTDLIYGNSSVLPSKSEPFVAGSLLQNELVDDLIYGEHKPVPSRGEAHERIVGDRENSSDLIYGGSCVIYNIC